MVNNNVFWCSDRIIPENRHYLLGQKGIVVWFTGIPGSGKSTISAEVEKKLFEKGRVAYRLDGDNIRCGLNSDLGFSGKDREENIRRIAEVAALFKEAGIITLVSFISPFKKGRDFARKKVSSDNFIEVYVKAKIETCIKRDPKNLYKKALRGEIKDFTGVNSDYEKPKHPEIIIDTDNLSIKDSVEKIVKYIENKEGKLMKQKK